MSKGVWKKPEIISWSQLLLESYEKRLGYPLLDRKGNSQNKYELLFFAPFVVVSHGTETDPILNYGNQIALDLWELSWEDFTQTPSRLLNRQLLSLHFRDGNP